MPAMTMMHEEDPREVLLKTVGNLDEFEIFHDQVLVAVYQRPKKTASGIYLADSTLDEDKTQGKAGLIVKMGSRAFKDDSGKWDFAEMNLHDWVYFRASDGWAITVNKVLCRIVDDVNIRGRIQHPDQVW